MSTPGVPTASEIPSVAVHHLETPCNQTETGSKGMGEGGLTGAPTAVVAALNDALRGYGAEIDCIPVHPADVLGVLNGSGVLAASRLQETA